MEHEHEFLAGLLDGVNQTLVGGPSVQLPAAAGAPSVNAFGALSSLVKFSADIAHKRHPMKLGRVPIVLTASAFVQAGTGPVVGVCRFGSGNGSQQSFEFDIQQGFPLFTVPNITNAATSGGTLFSLPCTSLEINARNDANLLATAAGDPLGLVAGAAVPIASASIGIGNRGSSKPLTRTIYGIYAPASAGGRLAAAGIVQIGVPAFAKRFRTFRTDATQPISVQLTDGTGTIFDGPYNEAANAPSATYDLPTSCSSVVITNTGAAALKVVGCVFELGL